MISFIFFFFSSRRRHTRWNCDWSSDVCSSDLFMCSAFGMFPLQKNSSLISMFASLTHTFEDAADVAQTTEGRVTIQRSEEHTSELQSQFHLVCRLLLEKKNNTLPDRLRLDSKK